MKKLFLISLILPFLSFSSEEQICVDGVRPLHISPATLTVKTRVGYKVISNRLNSERVVGEAFENLTGFFTLAELQKRYCGTEVSGKPAHFYPSYAKTLGQNGFYWYLKTESEKQTANFLYILEGEEKDGKCESLLEGAARSVLQCPNE